MEDVFLVLSVCPFFLFTCDARYIIELFCFEGKGARSGTAECPPQADASTHLAPGGYRISGQLHPCEAGVSALVVRLGGLLTHPSRRSRNAFLVKIFYFLKSF